MIQISLLLSKPSAHIRHSKPSIPHVTYKAMQTNPLLELQVSYNVKYTLDN